MRTESQDMKAESGRTAGQKIRINDIAFRLIVIPVCGIGIPLLTRMIVPNTMSHGKLKLAFLFSIGIAWIIFHGNKYLHNTLRSYFDWYKKPYQKIIGLLVVIPFYTVPVSVILLVIWYQLFNEGVVIWPVVKQTTLVIMLAVVFIVHIYETVFLVKEAESEMVHRAEVDRARIQAELDALKNQIDPHFMFNSLNTLSYLIEKHPDKAIRFNDHLADVYRYILSNKSRDLVLLSEEIAFLRDYYALIKIRFDQAVNFSIEIPDSKYDQYLVPPISLQIPAENAIKHNEFSNEQPLEVTLTCRADDTLLFSNPVSLKKQIKPSPGIGLENLNNRYNLITGKQIEFRLVDKKFNVILPLVQI
jgi:sensor histidine kinase YesM